MAEIDSLIEKASQFGVVLRLSLAADGVASLPDNLLAEIKTYRDDLITLLARQLAAPSSGNSLLLHKSLKPTPMPTIKPAIKGKKRQPPILLRSRPRFWSPTEDRPSRGDFCQDCKCQVFQETDLGWRCEWCCDWINMDGPEAKKLHGEFINLEDENG